MIDLIGSQKVPIVYEGRCCVWIDDLANNAAINYTSSAIV